MIRVLLNGCNGKMGRTVTELAAKQDDLAIVAGVDCTTDSFGGFPVFLKPQDVTDEFDLILDFSVASAVDGILDYAARKGKPIVVCTTGLSDAQIEKIKSCSEEIPVFFSANMSLGIPLITDLAVKVSQILGEGFDIEIVEKHHNQKVDAPSGTALKIAEAIDRAGDEQYHFEYDRHAKRAKRSKNEIGIHSVRGGTIVGEHEIIFAGEDEVISIKHEAFSKKIFANGALNAVRFLMDKEPGLYDMNRLLK